MIREVNTLQLSEPGFEVASIVKPREGFVVLELRFDLSKVTDSMARYISKSLESKICFRCNKGVIMTSKFVTESDQEGMEIGLSIFMNAVDHRIKSMSFDSILLEFETRNNEIISSSADFNPGSESRLRPTVISNEILKNETSNLELLMKQKFKSLASIRRSTSEFLLLENRDADYHEVGCLGRSLEELNTLDDESILREAEVIRKQEELISKNSDKIKDIIKEGKTEPKVISGTEEKVEILGVDEVDELLETNKKDLKATKAKSELKS